jgi:hypothetical protein
MLKKRNIKAIADEPKQRNETKKIEEKLIKSL